MSFKSYSRNFLSRLGKLDSQQPFSGVVNHRFAHHFCMAIYSQ